MTEEEKFKKALDRLARDSEEWVHIKKILEERIRGYQELISFIDNIVKEKEDKIAKLN